MPLDDQDWTHVLRPCTICGALIFVDLHSGDHLSSVRDGGRFTPGDPHYHPPGNAADPAEIVGTLWPPGQLPSGYSDGC